MTTEERRIMKQKRIAFISKKLNGYSSLEEYARDKDEWFAILDIALSQEDDCISLCNYISYNAYESYHIVPTGDEHLAVSHIIRWQHPFCHNDIFKYIHQGKCRHRGYFHLLLTNFGSQQH